MVNVVETSIKVNPVDTTDGLEITGFLHQGHVGDVKEVEARPKWLEKECNVRARASI